MDRNSTGNVGIGVISGSATITSQSLNQVNGAPVNANSTPGTGLQSIADLTASMHMTTGDVPPPLVGPSTTMIGTKLYLFAGRLVSARKMTNTLYVLDLETFIWKRLQPLPDQANVNNGGMGIPRPRYFHSANEHRQSLIFFGGMGYTTPQTNEPPSPTASANETLCVLDDVFMYNVERNSWFIPSVSTIPHSALPKPRYAHLSSITAGRLTIIGGQDMSNNYITEMNVLDIHDWTWVTSRPFEKHCGAYRSVAMSSNVHTQLPQYGLLANVSNTEQSNVANTSSSSSRASPVVPPPSTGGNDVAPSSPILSVSESPDIPKNQSTPSINQSNSFASTTTSQSVQSVGGGSGVGTISPVRSRVPSVTGSTVSQLQRQSSFTGINTGSNSFCRLPYATKATEENPNPIYLYSNYNFTDVKRELQVISPPTSKTYQIVDQSSSMSGVTLPPGLRFPTGAILGQHLIISGTYLTNASQTFSIWALNLGNYVWTRIDTGTIFSQGMGDKQRTDNGAYIAGGSWNRGLMSDVFNKYVVLGNRDRSLVEDYNRRQINFDHVTLVHLEAFGVYQPPPITMAPLAQELGLAMLDDATLADFAIQTVDGDIIPINSHIVSCRWSYFKELVSKNGINSPSQNGIMVPTESVPTGSVAAASGPVNNINNFMTPTSLPILRTLQIPETTAVVLALLQFLYTDHLLTSHQYQAQVLSHLLVLSELYRLPKRLGDLATHALHQVLNMSTAAMIYETAALTRRTGLQIRSLKVMIAAKKTLSQKEREKVSNAVAVPPISGTTIAPSSVLSSTLSQPASTTISLSVTSTISSVSEPGIDTV